MNSNMLKIESCPLCNTGGTAHFKGYKFKGYQGLFPPRKYEEAYKVYRCKACDLVYTDCLLMSEGAIFEKDDSLLKLMSLDVTSIKNESRYTDVLDFLKENTKVKEGAKVLDIGSGIGRITYVLRKEKFDTYALEPKKELFDFGISNNFTDKEKTFNCSFEAAEFEKETFDFIFLEPLNHLANPHVAIQKALGWLKPGAYLHLQVVNNRWLYKQLLQFFYKLTLRKHVPYTSVLRKPFNVCEYSSKSFKVYAALNYLKLCQINSYPCNTFIKSNILNKWVSYYMWRFNQGMELSLILKKL